VRICGQFIDAKGNPVADHTQVRLSSTLGRMDADRETFAGVAEATYDGYPPGKLCTVTATCDHVTAHLRFQFPPAPRK